MKQQLLSPMEAAKLAGVSKGRICWLCRNDATWKKRVTTIMDDGRILRYKIPLSLVKTYTPVAVRQAAGKTPKQKK